MKKIIIIQLSRMGDVIFSLPLLKTLKQEYGYGDCHITMISYKGFTEVIKDSPLVDRFLRIESGEISKLANFDESDPGNPYPELTETYDICINLAYDVAPAKLCSRLKAGVKYGRVSSQKDEVRLLGDWMKYLFSIVHNRDYNLFSMADIFTRCGGIKNRKVANYMGHMLEDDDHIDVLLKENGYIEGKLIGFQMGASDKHRKWAIENFVQLGRRLKEFDPDIQIMLMGSKAETGLGDDFIKLADFPVINFIGKEHIRELPSLLARCSYLISNDTGPIHIAAAIGTPVLCISFGSAYYAETGPYGVGHYVVQSELPCQPCVDYTQCSHMDCRKVLTVDAVFAAAKEVIGGSGDLVFDFPDLAFYSSQFLENGTLLYSPVFRKSISPKFQKGFLYRIMWENTEDVEVYRRFMLTQLPELKTLPEFIQLLSTFSTELTTFNEIFNVGVAACDQLNSIFSSGQITQEAIAKPLQQLNIIETFLGKREEPLSPLKHYFSFEIMDMDFLQFPALAEELKKKYLKLKVMSEKFLLNLRTLMTE